MLFLPNIGRLWSTIVLLTAERFKKVPYFPLKSPTSYSSSVPEGNKETDQQQ